MSDKHGSGQLTLFTQYGDHEIRGKAGELIAVSASHQHANARRMVACWNACRGVSIDWLEGRAEGMQDDSAPIDELVDSGITKEFDLTAQRDELLAALGELVPHVLHYASMPGAHQDASRDAARARAAITKIEGAKT
jgi:hypothetical protein